MYFELEQDIFDGLRGICEEVRENSEKMTVNAMLMKMMDMQDLPMHCPYHHFIVPAAMLTQAAIDEDRDSDTFNEWMRSAEERAKTVPAGFCGECGTCGAAVGIGIFVSVYTGATPKSKENWQWANEVTGKCLQKIASYPGPRCCKRTAFLAVAEGVPYVNNKCGTALTVEESFKCRYHDMNAECLESECPYYESESIEKNTGCPIIVGHEMMPRKEPGRTCECMNRPVEMESKKGIVSWLKDEGDEVKAGETICEGEVDKLVVEFESPCDGILANQCIKEGQVFTAGTVLGYVKKV